MIPIKLDLQGLYSYREKQTIDFTQLTAAGLFGIFGAVGSGKSSILEAILLSLYGNTERLASRGEKTSMINLQSEILSISFEFRAGKNNAEAYKAVYVSKRNKKNFDDVKPAEHSFYHKTSGGWLPIAENGEALVGMKMEHFRQTVIIPQGKFRDFIEQKPMARAEMMKELFGLERFDLSAKSGSLLKKVNEEKIRLETQLHTLEEASFEIQREKEILLEKLLIQRAEQGKHLQTKEAAFNQLKIIKEMHNQLIKLENKAHQLQTQQPEIEKKRTELRDFRKAVTFIQPILVQLREKKIEAEKYDVSFRECVRWKTDYEATVAKLENEEQKLKGDQNKKGERETKIRDLSRIIEINALESELAQNKNEVDQLLPKSEKEKSQLSEFQRQINELEAREELMEVPDAQELADLKSALREWMQLETAQKDLHKEVNELNQQKSLIRNKIADLTSLLPEKIKDFEQWINQQNLLLEEQQVHWEKLIQQQGLASYSRHLVPGENCPLCGSPDHPHPLSEHFDEASLKENTLRTHQLKTELEKIRKLKSSWEKETIQQKALEDHLASKSSGFSSIEEQIQILIAGLKAKEIKSQEEIKSHLEKSEKALKEQQQLNRQLKQLRQDYQKQKKQFEEDEKQLRKAEQQLLTINTTIVAQRGEIKFPDFSLKYLDKSRDEITQDIERVQKAIDELELNLKRNQDRLKEARKNQTTNLANLQSFEKLSSETKEKLIHFQNELAAQLLENGFAHQKEAVQLLDNPIDLDEWEKEIKAFENQVEITQDRLKELKENEEVIHYKEAAFQELASALQKAKEAFEQVKEQNTLLQREIAQLKEKLQQKETLSTAMAKVEKREMNLKELERLFKGNGFVKYMSSIYLKELCLTANIRFLKLTKNSLSLEMDEDNNFWVRDYLNGGKKRLLKSLSGGQTFQASLCLALALAEKVKSLNRADQSFFFLDEGFGALDKASLRTVFEALKTLRHENRVVGIISHVEELQQEIEVYARVELDSETGSKVSYSF
ncbi:MAG: SMC family ATPase [Anditalea sp.]